MKSIAKFLSLLLCFELVVAPIGTNIGIMNNNAYALSCPTGQVPNAELNRCLTSDQAAQVLNATRNCGGDMDCYTTQASDALNNSGVPESRQVNKIVSGLTKGAALLLPIIMAENLYKLKILNNVCGKISYWLMVGAGVSMIVGDIIINYSHYNRLTNIREEWGKVVNPTSVTGDKDKQEELSINAQSEAFQKLADAEGSMAKAANEKQILYNIAAAAYGAAAIVAALELIQIDGWTKCKKVETNEKLSEKAKERAKKQFEKDMKDIGEKLPKIELPKPKPLNIPRPIPTGLNNEIKKDFLYANVFENDLTSDKKFLNSLSKPFIQNLIGSKNFTDLIMNQKALEKTHSSPSLDEYEEVNNSIGEINEIVENAPGTFQLLKTVTTKIMTEMNPVQYAIANDENKSNAAMAFEQDGKAFEGWGYIAGAAVLGGVMLLGDWANKFNDFMLSSWGRVIVGGVLGTTTFFLARHAGKVEEEANTRKDKLLKLKAEFNVAASSIDTCKSEDRDNPGKPNCYCYTPENQRNTNRYNSQVCTRLWGGANVNFKNASKYSSDQKICITKTYNPDPLCSCRKTASCLKSSVGNMQGIGSGTLTMLNSGLGPMNSLTSGDASLGQLGSTNPGSTAIRMLNALDKLVASKPMAKHKGLIDKGAKELTTSMNQAAAQIPQQNLASSGSSALPTNAKEAARMLEKELTPSGPTSVTGNQGTIATPTGSEEKMPDFGMSDDQAAQQESQVAEVMGKNLDYGGTDINNTPKANIFEVLTNRYQRSGMRRLFDENNTAPVEAPSKTEINK